MTRSMPSTPAHIIHADCLAALRDMPDASMDAVGEKALT